MTDAPHAARMTAGNLASMHAHLAREAEDIAAAAARFAEDVDRGIATGMHSRIAQDVQQFLIRAARYDATKDVAELYDAELAMEEGK